ncbi:MAG: TetR/AcrR family transcriptional regulator [Nitrospiraceae bacterium]|nr:MAG: TetR/AcrR family transcriptional regulator [Nitrospiraceae bacterium]
MVDHSRGTRRERKKEETRQKIMKIAMYFFRKQGFESTTMDQIAEEVDISKATLYNYFPVKEAIISEHWNSSVRELKLQILELIQLLPDTKSRVQKTFTKAAYELFKSKEDIYTIYLNYLLRNLNNPSSRDSRQSGFEDIFSMIVKLGQQSGDLRKDMPVELLVKVLEVMFLTACINWLSDPKLFPLEKTLAQTVSLIIEGAGMTPRRGRSKSESRDFDQGSLL